MTTTRKSRYWKEVIQMLEEGTTAVVDEIDFNNEKLGFKEVALLNRNGFRVPEHLIQYPEDDAIDFTDNPDITQNEIDSLNSVEYINTSLPIEKEITDWIKKENIKLNELVPHLLKSFYQSVKFAQKNTAL